MNFFDSQYDRELKDPRGRTPLHLAVTLGHTKCAQLLVEHGANCLAENRHQWTCVAEAVCCGQPELLASILSHHEHQLIQERSRTVPQLLDTLYASPDFYVEMKWEFTSWGVSGIFPLIVHHIVLFSVVPFLSRMCPSDTYKIWKKGTLSMWGVCACVRARVCLHVWLCGERSYVGL